MADFNLSSIRTRQERARYLASRANTSGREVDWTGLIEQLCQQVIASERAGQPAVDLRTVPRPSPVRTHEVSGLVFPQKHLSLFYGDGGAGKSLIALWFLGQLAQRGVRVALFDWETDRDEHRVRLESLFPDGMPSVIYNRCDRPLTVEADHLRRVVRDKGIEFAVCDSIGFACDGPPESAEVANAYLRAARSLRIGIINIGHHSKGEGGDKRPFGSVFWWNGGRSIWLAKKADSSPGENRATVGCFHAKVNGPLCPPTGFEITFEGETTSLHRVDVADDADLSQHLSIRQRMIGALRNGAMAREKLAETIGAKPETIKRTANRDKRNFVVLDGGFIGLREKNL